MIDPGEHTGVALFSDSLLVDTTTITDDEHLIRLLRDARDEDAGVIIEAAPAIPRHQPDATMHVHELVRAEAGSIYYIQPSQWKGHPFATPRPEDIEKVSTQHERDAVAIGRWYLAMRRFNAIEERQQPETQRPDPA